MKTNLPISCVIPSYNGQLLLKKHLPSVFDALQDKDQLVIIDDASTDATVQWLKEEYHLTPAENNYFQNSSEVYSGIFKAKDKNIDLLLISNSQNVRFAKAVNRAVHFVSHPYFFLVNTDVSLQKRTLSILREQAQNDPSIFAIGCLEYADSKSGEKSGKNRLWFEKGLFQHSKANDFKSGPTAWASGGSALFSTEKWLELGGFDPAYYPAYWEDTDISFRARKKGWRVLFNEDAVVYHKHESTNATVFSTSSLSAISWRNAMIFTWKNATFLQRILFVIWLPYWQIKRFLHSN